MFGFIKKLFGHKPERPPTTQESQAKDAQPAQNSADKAPQAILAPRTDRVFPRKLPAREFDAFVNMMRDIVSGKIPADASRYERAKELLRGLSTVKKFLYATYKMECEVYNAPAYVEHLDPDLSFISGIACPFRILDLGIVSMHAPVLDKDRPNFWVNWSLDPLDYNSKFPHILFTFGRKEGEQFPDLRNCSCNNLFISEPKPEPPFYETIMESLKINTHLLNVQIYREAEEYERQYYERQKRAGETNQADKNLSVGVAEQLERNSLVNLTKDIATNTTNDGHAPLIGQVKADDNIKISQPTPKSQAPVFKNRNTLSQPDSPEGAQHQELDSAHYELGADGKSHHGDMLSSLQSGNGSSTSDGIANDDLNFESRTGRPHINSCFGNNFSGNLSGSFGGGFGGKPNIDDSDSYYGGSSYDARHPPVSEGEHKPAEPKAELDKSGKPQQTTAGAAQLKDTGKTGDSIDPQVTSETLESQESKDGQANPPTQSNQKPILNAKQYALLVEKREMLRQAAARLEAAFGLKPKHSAPEATDEGKQQATDEKSAPETSHLKKLLDVPERDFGPAIPYDLTGFGDDVNQSEITSKYMSEMFGSRSPVPKPKQPPLATNLSLHAGISQTVASSGIETAGHTSSSGAPDIAGQQNQTGSADHTNVASNITGSGVDPTSTTQADAYNVASTKEGRKKDFVFEVGPEPQVSQTTRPELKNLEVEDISELARIDDDNVSTALLPLIQIQELRLLVEKIFNITDRYSTLQAAGCTGYLLTSKLNAYLNQEARENKRKWMECGSPKLAKESLAFEACHLAGILTIGADLGYLDTTEVLMIFKDIKDLLLENFSSWEEYGDAIVEQLNRCDKEQESFKAVLFAIEQLKTNYYSPWNEMVNPWPVFGL